MEKEKSTKEEAPNALEKLLKAASQDFPPQAYKDVKLGGMSLTAIDAYYIVERLNKLFGPIGYGWGISDLKYEHYEDGSCSCKGDLWYRITVTGGEKPEAIICKFPSIGTTDGVWSSKQDQFLDSIAEREKKATTNLVSKASSFLEVGISVYKGLYEGAIGSGAPKPTGRQFTAQPQPANQGKPQPQTTGGGKFVIDKKIYCYGYKLEYDSAASKKLSQLKYKDPTLAMWGGSNKQGGDGLWWLSKRVADVEKLDGFGGLTDLNSGGGVSPVGVQGKQGSLLDNPDDFDTPDYDEEPPINDNPY